MYRFLHKFWAHLFGYAWLPCVICGDDFSGHEIKGACDSVSLPNGKRRICCPKCSYYAGLIDGINQNVQFMPQYAKKLLSDSAKARIRRDG